MKLIKVKKADDNDIYVEHDFYQKCVQQSERGAKKQNGFCEYTFNPSKWNKNDYVEVFVSMPSASGDGSGKVVSVDDAIKVTEARLATLKECKSKLKKLQDEAKSLGLKKEK